LDNDRGWAAASALRNTQPAYIDSQRHEGWLALDDRYDDGGYSGGTLERPALQRPIRDIEAGRVDTVVCYKIDRLSRSLTDFTKLLASPELIARTITAVRRENGAAADTQLEEGEVIEALGALEPVWDELYPAEQARILRLLIEEIDVAPDGISMTLHAAGIRTLVAELADQEPPAPAVSEGLLEAAE
jgi:hypothetical protein